MMQQQPATIPATDNITIKVATLNDLAWLLIMAEEFVAETHYGFTFNRERALNRLSAYIQLPDSDVLLVTKNNLPVGWSMVAYDDEFHDERMGYISKFYIAKEGRRSRAARSLAKACAAWFDVYGCYLSFATATANIGENKLFENLLGKEGFKPCGETLTRRKP